MIQKLHILFLCCMVFASCQFGVSEKDGSDLETDVSVFRYDKLLNEYVEFNSFSALQKMNTEHLLETKYLIEDVLRLGQINDDNISKKLKTYYSDTTLRKLMADVLIKYKDLEEVEKKLSRSFKLLKKEIPELKVPSIYAQVSALNESVVVGDSLLGFSLDKYMGTDYPLYKRYFYEYQCKSMRPERIVPDCISFYLISEYPFPENCSYTLMDVMLHAGKIHYVTTKAIEGSSFKEQLDYTVEEDKWCKSNRENVWKYMIQHNHLYATDPMVVRKYTKPAPYTAFFGEQAPARLGHWIGLMIIDSYMKNNKISLKELLEMTNYQEILTKSKFKP